MPETRDCQHQWADITVTADGGKCDRFFCIHCDRVKEVAPNFWTAIVAAPDPIPRRPDDAEIVS